VETIIQLRSFFSFSIPMAPCAEDWEDQLVKNGFYSIWLAGEKVVEPVRCCTMG